MTKKLVNVRRITSKVKETYQNSSNSTLLRRTKHTSQDRETIKYKLNHITRWGSHVYSLTHVSHYSPVDTHGVGMIRLKFSSSDVMILFRYVPRVFTLPPKWTLYKIIFISCSGSLTSSQTDPPSGLWKVTRSIPKTRTHD